MNFDINIPAMVQFLEGLLKTPSPTGFTDMAVEYVKTHFAHLPFEMHTTPKGLLIGTWLGENDDIPRALTAHIDTLGAVVEEIKSNGRLKLSALGGWAPESVEGEGVTIFTGHDQTLRGSFLPITASAHAFSRRDKSAVSSLDKMEVRIDTQTQTAAQTKALGIDVGDFVAFDPRVEIAESGFIRSRHLDDKAGVAVIYAALSALAAAGLRPTQTTTIHISNYEEVGHGAATGFPADLVELVAVDMAVVAPKQQSDEFSVTICAKDSRGPYDYRLRRHLEKLARENDLRYCNDVYKFYGSDGEAYWRAGADVQVGLIGPGVDASHHYERTHIDALDNSARLLAHYLLS